jgi:hypothetical protein
MLAFLAVAGIAPAAGAVTGVTAISVQPMCVGCAAAST